MTHKIEAITEFMDTIMPECNGSWRSHHVSQLIHRCCSLAEELLDEKTIQGIIDQSVELAISALMTADNAACLAARESGDDTQNVPQRLMTERLEHIINRYKQTPNLGKGSPKAWITT